MHRLDNVLKEVLQEMHKTFKKKVREQHFTKQKGKAPLRREHRN